MSHIVASAIDTDDLENITTNCFTHSYAQIISSIQPTQQEIEQVVPALDIDNLLSDNNNTCAKEITELDKTEIFYIHTVQPLPTAPHLRFRDWWVIDRGSPVHIYNNLNSFTEFNPLSADHQFRIATGKGSEVLAEGIGTVFLAGITHNSIPTSIQVTNMLYIPDFITNIISLYH